MVLAGLRLRETRLRRRRVLLGERVPARARFRFLGGPARAAAVLYRAGLRFRRLAAGLRLRAGARRLDAGVHENVYVKLLRNTDGDKLYYIILYSDDGDGEFDIKKDSPFLTAKDAAYVTFETVTVDRKNN